MDKSLKLTKKKIDTLLKNKEYIRDEQNRIVVEMTVQNDKNFLSEFSQTKTPVINTKVAEFIENSTYSIPIKEPLTLRITSDCISDNEKEGYSKGIKEYYKQKYFLNQKDIKQNYLIATILTFVSLVLLTTSILFKLAAYLPIPIASASSSETVISYSFLAISYIERFLSAR